MSRVDDDGHENDLVMPGFRFHPTEEELIDFYLRRKVEGRRFNVELIAFLDLYRYDPWELPALATVGEKEWFFYVPRDRKYRNGDRPNRVTRSGYWKATGVARAVRAQQSSRSAIGLKKTLVFYSGRAPNGIRTSWIMNEYRLPQTEVDISLCRVYNKAGVEDHDQFPGTLPYNNGPSSTREAAPGQGLQSSNSHQSTPAGFQSIIINVDDSSSSPILDELQIRAETNTPTSSSSVVTPVPAALYGSTASATSLSPATSTNQEDFSTLLLHQSNNGSDPLTPITASYLNSGTVSSFVSPAPTFDELWKVVNPSHMSCMMNTQPNSFLIQTSSIQPRQPLQVDVVSNVPVLSDISDELREWNPQFP